MALALRDDVLAAHLEAAASLFPQFEHALASPLYHLGDVRARLEARWLAHLDGLYVAGPEYFETHLRPELEAVDPDDTGRFISVAMVAIQLGQLDAVLAPLIDGDAATRRAALRALSLAENPAIDRWVARSHGPPGLRAQRIALMHLAGARKVPLDPLLLPLQSDDEAEVVAALDAARWADRHKYLSVVEWLLSSGPVRVQRAAIAAGLVWNSNIAWTCCKRLANDPATCDAALLQWIALLGGPDAFGTITQALTWDTHREAATRALGLTGDAGMAEHLLPLLTGPDPRLSRLAAEALATIGGLDLHDEAFDPGYTDEPSANDRDDETPDDGPHDTNVHADRYADELPDVHGPAIASWWQHASLPRGCRLLLGSPDIHAQRASLVRQGTMRQRAVIAEELTIRSRGTIRVDPTALSIVQAHQAADVSSLAAGDLPVRFSSW